ncbi:MAG: hypothetical protein Q9159_003173 [Coniocarpon cinnabarinum]
MPLSQITPYTTAFSNLLTSTTSRYASIRQRLLPDDTDGDTEDDTHICRVLRAYYVEKGIPFPPWLPPDPKDKYSAYGQNMGSQYAQQPQAGGPYGPHAQRYGGASAATGPKRGGLSDLWDSGPSQETSAPTSLRAGRQNPATAAASQVYNPSGNPAMGGGRSERLAPVGGRPLPSQREGSYQSLRSQRGGGLSQAGSTASEESVVSSRPSVASTAPATTQDRLKARLWGGRTGSPAPGSGGGGGGGY